MMADPPPALLYDRALLVKRWRRAQRFPERLQRLYAPISDLFFERLCELSGTFSRVLQLGTRAGSFKERCGKQFPGKFGANSYVFGDLAPAPGGMVLDEEALDFPSLSFNAVFSFMSLHWCNLLPQAVEQIHNLIVPGGVFLAVVPSGEGMKPLAQACMEAEEKVYDGVSPRFSPPLEVRDLGNLMSAAGFRECVADRQSLTLAYERPLQAVNEWRKAGEANALMARKRMALNRDFLLAFEDSLGKRLVQQNGVYPFPLDLIFLIGWR